MKKFIRIGVDLAKNYFQIHALASEGAPAMTRVKMREFFSQIEPCRVGMEACGTAHYWARELKSMGHEVLLMPPTYTKPCPDSVTRTQHHDEALRPWKDPLKWKQHRRKFKLLPPPLQSRRTLILV